MSTNDAAGSSEKPARKRNDVIGFGRPGRPSKTMKEAFCRENDMTMPELEKLLAEQKKKKADRPKAAKTAKTANVSKTPKAAKAAKAAKAKAASDDAAGNGNGGGDDDDDDDESPAAVKAAEDAEAEAAEAVKQKEVQAKAAAKAQKKKESEAKAAEAAKQKEAEAEAEAAAKARKAKEEAEAKKKADAEAAKKKAEATEIEGADKGDAQIAKKAEAAEKSGLETARKRALEKKAKDAELAAAARKQPWVFGADSVRPFGSSFTKAPSGSFLNSERDDESNAFDEVLERSTSREEFSTLPRTNLPFSLRPSYLSLDDAIKTGGGLYSRPTDTVGLESFLPRPSPGPLGSGLGTSLTTPSPAGPSKSPDFDPAVVKLEKFGGAQETSLPPSLPPSLPTLSPRSIESLSPGPSPLEVQATTPQGPNPGPTDAKDPKENKQPDVPFLRKLKNTRYTLRGTYMSYAEIEGLLDLEPLSAAQYPLPEDPVHQELYRHLSRPKNASLSWWARDDGLVFNDHVRLLWYTMPRRLRCLPTQLLSPLAGVQHAGDRDLDLAIKPPLPWEPRFMDLMTQLSSFKAFVDKPKLAQILIKLAVIVKTNDCRPWIFEDPVGDFYLRRFSEIACSNRHNVPVSEIHEQVKRKLVAAGLYLSSIGDMFDSVICLNDSADVSRITGEEAPSVYFVTADHLEYLVTRVEVAVASSYHDTMREWRCREEDNDPAPCDSELKGLLGKAHIVEMLKYRGCFQTRLRSLGKAPPQVAAVASLAPANVAESPKPEEGAAPAIVAGQPPGHKRSLSSASEPPALKRARIHLTEFPETMNSKGREHERCWGFRHNMVYYNSST